MTKVLPRHDLHTHTFFSPCGDKDESKSSPAVYAAEAARRGIEILGITDHIALPGPGVPKWYETTGPQNVEATRRAVAQINIPGLDILVGCEAEILSPGHPSITPEFAATLDYVVFAASHFHKKGVKEESLADPKVAARHMIAYLDEALSLPYIDILAHFFVAPNDCLGLPEAVLSRVAESNVRRIVRAATERGIAIEVNGAVPTMESRRACYIPIFKIAKDEGARFCVGSDSHTLADFSRLDALEAYAREIGLAPSDFLDARIFISRRKQRHVT